MKEFLSHQDTENLVHAFVFSRLNYYCGVFTVLCKKSDSCSLSGVLQRESKRVEHITPLL